MTAADQPVPRPTRSLAVDMAGNAQPDQVLLTAFHQLLDQITARGQVPATIAAVHVGPCRFVRDMLVRLRDLTPILTPAELASMDREIALLGEHPDHYAALASCHAVDPPGEPSTR